MKPVRLRDVEIRHLQALQAVAAEGSFGRAAERMGFSQSAVSQQIAAFERVVGHPLFDRPGGPRKVVLTPVGRVLLDHADAVLGQLRRAEEDVEALLAGAGRLIIGSFQSVSVKVLPTVIGRILGELPGLSIRCVETDTLPEWSDALLDGELDLSFVVGDTDDEIDELDYLTLCIDPFVLVSPVSSPSTPLPVQQLNDLPMVGEQRGTCLLTLEAGLRQHGVEPAYVFRSNDNSAVQAMVGAGMGHAVMPYLAVDLNDPAVVVRELVPALPPRRISIARRRGRTLVPAADRFVEIATEVCAQLSRSESAA